jgi:hypothetical protein
VAPTTRELWQATEAVHAVAYFAPEVADAVAGSGVKGWWRGYFAGRAAPMGVTDPSVVTAVFANFAPAMVERALPSAWQTAGPREVLAARAAGLTAAFARVDAPDGVVTDALRPVLELLDRAADAAPLLGRPLAAAWARHRTRLLRAPDEPSPALRAWLATTVLREQRGDAHVAAVANAGLDGCEVLVTLVGTGRVPAEMLREARGWTLEEWEAASARLVDRGLIRPDGRLTSDGMGLRIAIEDATDRAAAVAWAVLDDDERDQVFQALRPLGALLAERVPIRVPNPMGWEPLPG